jgi:predicted GIY-YIG superfamily endonuclease
MLTESPIPGLMASSSQKGPARPKSATRSKKRRTKVRCHHCVYVVFLRNPKGDGKAGYYVGMTGLTPDRRFANHKAGVKSASVVRKFGVRLVPLLYEHLNPMPYGDAVRMEVQLADSLRKRGFQVFGGH